MLLGRRIGFFADALSNRGHKVSVLGAFTAKSLRKNGSRGSGKFGIFNLIPLMGLNNPILFIINSAFSFMGSTLFLIAKKPKIAIVSVPTGHIGLGAIMACRFVGSKYVVDYRDEWEDHLIGLTSNRISRLFYSYMKRVATCLYSKSVLITSVTTKTVNILIQRGNCNAVLITNGADVEAFKPPTNKQENKQFVICYAGGVGGVYRLDVAVRAIAKLVRQGLSDVKLVIAGEGETARTLCLASELGITKNIEYVGVINDQRKLVALFGEADVGLIPYDDNPLWKNSIPAKFYEYCSCGLPIIATAYECSLLSNLIRKNKIGVSSAPLNEEKLSESIGWLYYNKSFRESASKRARLLIDKEFDRNKIAVKFLSLIENLT